MNDKSNLYALAALKKKRGMIAGEIASLKTTLAHKKKQLKHVDETLRLFDPSCDPGKLPKNLRRVFLFKAGQLSCAIRDALREAKGKPLTTVEITTYVMAATGHDEEARRAIAVRVQAGLCYQRRCGTVEMVEKRNGICVWSFTGPKQP